MIETVARNDAPKSLRMSREKKLWGCQLHSDHRCLWSFVGGRSSFAKPRTTGD